MLVSGFRDPGRQWDVRNARYPGRECDRGCRDKPLTALPGRPNHQRRTAADIGGRTLAWATRNKSQYGLATPVRGEPWPFESAGRPSVTIRSIGGAAPRALEEDLTEDKLRKGVRKGLVDAFTPRRAGSVVFRRGSATSRCSWMPPGSADDRGDRCGNTPAR